MPLPSECQKHADKIQQLRAELVELEGGRDDAAKIARIWTAVAAAEDNLRACVRQHAPTYTTSVSYLDFSGTVMLPSRGRLLNSELNEIEAATVNNGLLSLASGSPDVPLPGPVGLVIQDSNPLATGPSFRSEVLKSIPPVSDPERIIEFAVPPPSRFSTTAMTAALAARFPASVGAPLVLGDGTSLAAIGLSVGIPA